MKAITQQRYGRPDVLEFTEVDQPELGEDDVLIRVKAASVNPYDWHMMTGKPSLVRLQMGLRRPKRPIQGADGAGTVEAVGSEVTEFEVGDAVFGSLRGSFAEFSTAKERNLVHKPDSISFEAAASVPIAALTALQALRDTGDLKSGQRVLVNGASGGVGTFAVMLAKAMGAHVTGVCSTRNVEMVRSIGADEVIDYTQQDYTRIPAAYDVILDNVTTKGVRANRRVMADDGVWVQTGMKNKWMISIIFRMLKFKVSNLWSSKKMKTMLSQSTKDDLQILADYLASGAVSPVIDRTYPLSETADAMRHQGEGHAQGKTVIKIA